MSPPTASHVKTPADLKWLLNERAALAGTLEKSISRRHKLVAQVEAEGQRTAMLQDSIAALDATMRLLHPRVPPTSAGLVNGWAGTYGKRGYLINLLTSALRDAAPYPLDSHALTRLVISRFELSIIMTRERKNLRRVVSMTMQRLCDRSLAEAIHDPMTRKPGAWRWKTPPTFADLAGAAPSTEGPARDAKPDPNPTNGQMDGQ